MSYLKLTAAEEVANFPAYKIVRRETNSNKVIAGKFRRVEFTDIVAFEKLGLKRNGYYQEFQPGSAVSYAMKNGADPLESVDRARRLGHELHWLNPCATVLTSHARPQETFTLIEIGMVVRFEGKLFTIRTAPNDNLRLEPVVFADAE